MIVRYSPKKHYKMIASWYRAREKAPPAQADLPEVGFVVGNRVAGWVVRTDCNWAFIEGVISNPNTAPSLRRHDMEVLAGVLIDAAHNLGYTRIGAVTSHPSIKRICNKHNFIETDQTLYVLEESMDEEEYENDLL